jgi:secondary thiamine-phosphate synthase enzyme
MSGESASRRAVTRLSPTKIVQAQSIATATLTVETPTEGFIELTEDARHFIRQLGAADGALFLFLRHTSASLAIQENADPDVQKDLMTALRRLAPEDAGWVHDVEGPDDMPAHVKAMLTGVGLHIPVVQGALALGKWQGIYLIEHRFQAHRREVVLQFIGRRGG